MIKRNHIVQEFDFRNEVLPILMLGIILNLGGRFLADVIGLRFLFMDMIGTAYASILLGPWWGATTGVIGNAINGNFFSNYFPFVVVNIFGALAWGYFSRITKLQQTLFRPGSTTPRQIIYGFIGLAIVGSLMAGLTSTLTKLAIYPPMGRPLLYGDFYKHSAAWLASHGLGHLDQVSILLLSDLLRELVDKSGVVACALAFVYATAFIPTTVASIRLHPVASQIRTDVASLFTFLVSYGVYLLIARLGHPMIFLVGAQHKVEWLRETEVIVLLYTPIALAIIVFLFLGLDSSRTDGRQVDADRWRRKNLYALLTAPQGWFKGDFGRFNFMRNPHLKTIYAMIISTGVGVVSSGPEKAFKSPVYFVIVGTLATGYFSISWFYRNYFTRAQAMLARLHEWMQDCHQPSDPAKIHEVLRGIFEDHLLFPAKEPTWYNTLSYAPCVNVGAQGMLGNLRQEDSFDHLVFLVVDTPRLVTPAILNDVCDIMQSTGIQTAYLLSATPTLTDDASVNLIRKERSNGRTINLMSWTDVVIGIRQSSKYRDVGESLMHAQLRTLENIGIATTQIANMSDTEPTLSRRALPSLAAVIDGLPGHTRVFDLGCGRGRHSFYALSRGHEVLAIDRHADAIADARAIAATVEEANERLTIMEGDYMSIDGDTTGDAGLVISTGVLQHATDTEDLRRRLEHLRDLAGHPQALVFIEMLLDMKFDGRQPEDGRIKISRGDFETLLLEVYSAADWMVERVNGPIKRHQSFKNGPRSFYPAASTVDVTSVEYLMQRET